MICYQVVIVDFRPVNMEGFKFLTSDTFSSKILTSKINNNDSIQSHLL